MTSTTLETALLANHQKRGAKCIPFANYKLPVWFSSIKEEHLSVRNNVGLFDISHMGLFRIFGETADSLLQKLSCNDIQKAKNSTLIYSFFLNESGMVLDDVMFGYHNNAWHLVVNGANTEKIHNWMTKHQEKGSTIEALNNTHSLIAIQGPKAAETIDRCFNINSQSLQKFGIEEYELLGKKITLSRSGYTGEDGFECMLPHTIAEQVWDTLIEAGAEPCGLGARDTLRIEYGLPLYGQELSESIHPYMTRYKWVLKNPQSFIGKNALTSLKETDHLQPVGLELDEAVIARPHYSIKEGGEISSGTLLPHNNRSIALAFVPKSHSTLGSQVTVLVRKKEIKATVVKVPFV